MADIHRCVQAETIADMRARLKRAEKDDEQLRADVRRLHEKLDAGFLDMKDAIATLRERSRNWGVIGGLLGSLGVSVIAAIVIAAVL